MNPEVVSSFTSSRIWFVSADWKKTLQLRTGLGVSDGGGLYVMAAIPEYGAAPGRPRRTPSYHVAPNP